jgi:hypothetical protein
MNPHWHATGDELQARPASASDAAPRGTPARVSIGSARVSRLPSAVVGVFIAILLGLGYFRGYGQLRSAVTDLTGLNAEQTSSLPSVADLMAPRATDSSSSAHSAKVVALNGSSSSAQTSTQPSAVYTFGGDPLENAAAASASSEPSPLDTFIPHNPYTVNSGVIRPADLLKEGTADKKTTAPITKTGTPKTMTESGPEVWIAGVASVAALAWILRKDLRSIDLF